jgi:hypothetical protein
LCVGVPLAVAMVVLTARTATALEVRIKEVRRVAAVVQASLELRDVIPERFQKVLEEHGALHLRLQAELWESRPVWDRLVYPAIMRVVRMTRDNAPSAPMPVTVDLGQTDRIVATGKYYVHVIATLGTLADKDADQVGDAVFGRESESNSLGSLGRLVFRTALQISDYLQSVSAEAKSRKWTGSELIRP